MSPGSDTVSLSGPRIIISSASQKAAQTVFSARPLYLRAGLRATLLLGVDPPRTITHSGLTCSDLCRLL